jgi:hypothetical protein
MEVAAAGSPALKVHVRGHHARRVSLPTLDGSPAALFILGLSVELSRASGRYLRLASLELWKQPDALQPPTASCLVETDKHPQSTERSGGIPRK